MDDTDTARSKPQSIIDTHRAVLELARPEALEVTVEEDGTEDLRGTVAELDGVIVLLRVRRIHDLGRTRLVPLAADRPAAARRADPHAGSPEALAHHR